MLCGLAGLPLPFITGRWRKRGSGAASRRSRASGGGWGMGWASLSHEVHSSGPIQPYGAQVRPIRAARAVTVLAEVVRGPTFRYGLMGPGIRKPPDSFPDGFWLTIGDPDGDRGRQSLTDPRWGGLLLARPGPALSIVHARAKDATKDAGESLSRFAKPSSLVAGRSICPVSSNGAPDCKAGADKLCQSKGYKEGRSLNTDSAETCSAKVMIPGRTGKPDDCRTDNFVTNALCQ